MDKTDQIGAASIARSPNVTTRSEPGKGYDHPKHWGDPANKGDIFQVTKADVDTNNEYLEGDFLIALKDGASSNYSYYPARGTRNEDWKYAWSKITKFTLDLNTSFNEATIYGNGLNQIGVVPHIVASDDNDVPVPLTPQVIRSAVQLLWYTKGVPLPSGWNTSFEQNQYHTLPPGQPMLVNREVESPSIYVTCTSDAGLRTITIGAQITASSGTVFYDTEDRGFHSSVVIKALEPKILRKDDLDINREKSHTGTTYGIVSKPDFSGLDLQPGSEKPSNWTQYDYFITPRNTAIEFINIVANGTYEVDGPSKGWWATYRDDNDENQLDMFFLWGASTQDVKRKVGDDNYKASSMRGPYVLDVCADITLPSRKNAVCATQLVFRPKYAATWYDSHYIPVFTDIVNWDDISSTYFPTFTFCDIYGNTSTIGVRKNSESTVMEIFDV